VIFLWITCDIAIVACDVAEVVGSAVALQLLLGVSLAVGVLMSAVGTFSMLALQSHGPRPLQAVVMTLIVFVGLCFFVELMFANPVWRSVLAGFVPNAALVRDSGMVWLAAGILGATVMPHNLYLHSALVKNLAGDGEHQSISDATRGVNIDTFVSLSVAFVVNAALLIVAAAVFHTSGQLDVSDLADAHRLIAPLVGSQWAAILFAAGLLACGLNATVTGTLAGQVVMEGFLQLKIARWARALLTRALAIGRESGRAQSSITARCHPPCPFCIGCRTHGVLSRQRYLAWPRLGVCRDCFGAESGAPLATGNRRLSPGSRYAAEWRQT
jgi:manganese transport protein